LNKLAALSEPLLSNQEGTARCHRSRSCLPAEALHRKLSALDTQRVSSDSGELAQVLPLHPWAKARSKICRPGAEPITCRDGSLLLLRTAHCAPHGSSLTACLLQGPAAVRGRGGAGGKSAQSICCRPQHRRCAAPLAAMSEPLSVIAQLPPLRPRCCSAACGELAAALLWGSVFAQSWRARRHAAQLRRWHLR